MFTGIVKGVGQICRIEAVAGDLRITVSTEGVDLGDYDVGSSICVNGACLTVVEFSAGGFSADISNETSNATTLGQLKAGSRVNLEPALRIGQPLDGHWVTGHVDGVARIADSRPDARSSVYGIEVPAGLGRCARSFPRSLRATISSTTS